MAISPEASTGRLGAVLHAPRTQGLTPLGPRGPWLVTDLTQARRVLTDATFDFPTTVSRGTDMSSSRDDSRTGHHVYAPLPAAQVERGRSVFHAEWTAALASIGAPGGVEFEAMDLLRRPVARGTCAAVLGDVPDADRDLVADRVLAWIDALGPVISSRRPPHRWGRARRGERRARMVLEAALTPVLAAQGVHQTPQVVANLLAAGVQVPIAAGAWLLVHLAGHRGPHVEPDHAVWETLRVTPPTWSTARVTTTPVDLAGHHLSAGSVVLVSPLLLGRLPALVPEDRADIVTFRPGRWAQDRIRPGAWLPFGAGAHACPGRHLGLGLLRDLAIWAGRHQLTLATTVGIDQSRGIFPRPARITASPRQADRP